MSKVDQLLAKAMSTTSEDEAIACLRMARKHGPVAPTQTHQPDYNGKSAEYWYDKAKQYHDLYYTVKGTSNGWQDLYERKSKQYETLRKRCKELETQRDSLMDKLTWLVPVGGIALICLTIMTAVY